VYDDELWHTSLKQANSMPTSPYMEKSNFSYTFTAKQLLNEHKKKFRKTQELQKRVPVIDDPTSYLLVENHDI
jgi:hypothetical protein